MGLQMWKNSKITNKAARILSASKYNAHTEPWKMDCHVFLYSIYFTMACNCYMSIITLVGDLERYI